MMFLEPWTADRGNPYYRSDPDPGFDVKNFEWRPYPVTVTDARTAMSTFSLDDHAFAFRPDPQGGAQDVLEVFKDNDDEQVQERYYPHVARVVKEVTGASEVIVFNHTVRRREPSVGLFGGSKGRQQPASTVGALEPLDFYSAR
ncbi:hypothetical protein MPH_00029 [Macrophomina phaseolina MS6]|uniref:Uncharacterized protein n=1 Tax=Macrophomina phaseolina (strain MS6) TaxID=1126212 RepID=K2T121_MACPH|nr:hypothetical protein MPH_00029 [Macrophomina phaseolina MS6]